MEPQNPLKPSQKKPQTNYWLKRKQREAQMLSFLDYALQSGRPAVMGDGPADGIERGFSSRWTGSSSSFMA